MCGIYCCLDLVKLTTVKYEDIYFTYLKYFLSFRGPDCSNSLETYLDNNLKLVFSSHVLHTTGSSVTMQPVTDESGNIMLWNGNIFGGLEINSSSSDTMVLFNHLKNCHSDKEVQSVFQKLQGPWSCIFWQAESLKLWFGRDVFGRRSLLVHLPCKSQPVLLLSSTYSRSKDFPLKLQELPANGLYCLDLKTLDCEIIELQCYPWAIPNLIEPSLLKIISSWKTNNNRSNNDLPEHLTDSIKLTVFNLIYLFLSNFNCIHTQALCDNYYLNPSIIRYEDFAEKTFLSGSHLWEQFMSKEFVSISDKFLHFLQEAVRIRVQNQPSYCQDCIKKYHLDEINSETSFICKHSKTAILFSGGIDSLVLATLADRCLPSLESIDLLNVAFEQIPKYKDGGNKSSASFIEKESNKYEVPDRVTGYKGLAELQKINPSRQWNFVEINISLAELQRMRNERLRHLVYPLQTVLDDSIGCAIWFAAKGEGQLVVLNQRKHYISKARIVLTGIGADEQLAGYSRHRAKFESEGLYGLVEEIRMELERISCRNLGRDDRMIADHGKDGRFPFLDENVVSYLNHLPIWQKANLKFPRGIGDKLLLRLSAHRLGLQDSTTLVKRAIQFGSRIAKLENNKEHASDKCDRLI